MNLQSLEKLKSIRVSTSHLPAQQNSSWLRWRGN